MMRHFCVFRIIASVILLCAGCQLAVAQSAAYGPHLWDKPLDPVVFEKRVNEQLNLAQKSIDQLLAVKGQRTIENTLAAYDDAIEKLDTVGNQSGVMQAASPEASVRDRAQAMVQKVSAVATALSLNPAVFRALSELAMSNADPGTQCYVKRTLLEFRLAGVDKDEATRARIQSLNDEVTKLHEFGHLMHWIFQGQQQWAGYGDNLESDFGEAPSMMLEEWMHDPKVLAIFARDARTGEPIPADLVRRANQADAFGRGLWARRLLVYTNVSFDLHNTTPDPAKLEKMVGDNTKRFVPYQLVAGDHEIASFTHLASYSSFFYTYLWDLVIAEDFFSKFNHHDLLEPEAARRYRSAVLEKTGSMPANELVKNFLGRPQSVDAFVAWMNQEFEKSPSDAKSSAAP